MYCGHPRLCVCLSVRGRMPTLLHELICNLGSGRGCPLVVHYLVDLQSGHGLCCYGNITRTRNVSEYILVLALCLFVHVFWMNRIMQNQFCHKTQRIMFFSHSINVISYEEPFLKYQEVYHFLKIHYAYDLRIVLNTLSRPLYFFSLERVAKPQNYERRPYVIYSYARNSVAVLF